MNYDEACRRLDELGSVPDLGVLERTADAIEPALWSSHEAGGYLRFFEELCRRLSSFDLGNWPEQDRLVRKYANVALRNAPELPLAAELALLEHLVPVAPHGTPGGAAWQATRRDAATRWLSALRRLDEEVDGDFDPDDVPLVNVPVPGENLPAGVAPEHVSDPALRREYERTVQRNAEHAVRYLRQVELRRLREHYRPVATRAIVDSYAQPPDDTDELRQLLADHESDPAQRVAIMSQLARYRGGER
jgi:hypothetical protein